MIDPANILLVSARVACVAVIAAALFVALRVKVAGVRYAFWRGVLALCLVLPLVPALSGGEAPIVANAGGDTRLFTIVASAAAYTRSGIEWSALIVPVLAAGILIRLAWIAIGLFKLRRLRHAGQVATLCAEDTAVRDALAPHADVRYVTEIGQPVTFGLRRPVVLLPEQVRDQDAEVREAILRHELLHVRRRDWGWVLVEEVVRAALWFHPAIWWLVSRVQIAREEVVDALVIRATGRRRAYAQALLAFADSMPPARAAAFANRRSLFRRIVLISKEDVMSRTRLRVSCLVMTMVVVATGWYTVRAFPLRQGSESGALERQAKPVTPENPIPRRLFDGMPKYPNGVDGVFGTVTIRLTLDASGRVAEARATQMTAQERRNGRRTAVSTAPAKADDPMVVAALDAVRQWQYEPPVAAPLTFDVTMRFQPGADTVLVGYGAAPPPPPPPPAPPAPTQRDAGVVGGPGSSDALAPPPPPPPPPPAWAEGALRIGGAIAPPRKVKDARPLYPPEAMAAKIEGIVMIEALIDESGRISHTRVIQSVPDLDRAAVDAVSQWEFTPTLLNGVPQPVFITMTVNFTLK